MNNIEILRNNTYNEFNAFEADMIAKDGQTIFNSNYEILFYCEYSEMLTSDFFGHTMTANEIAFLAQLDKPIAFLYEEWLYTDGALNLDWEEMADFIRYAIKRNCEN